jgi:2-polyprenyl-6-hydroxyphenyl methylase/3-demethylubiquinone-9 3-methyltransferase
MNPVRVSYFDGSAWAAFGLDRGTIRVLDVGCGGGLVSEALASLGYQVTGVDLSAGAIAAARRHAESSGVGVRYQVGSAYQLPADDASMDMVVLSDVLEHLHDLPAAVREVARVLRPGGIAVFDTINRTAASYLGAILVLERALKIIHPGTHNWRMFIRPHELRALFAANGLELTETRGLAPAAPPHRLLGAALRGRSLGGFRLADSTAVSYIGQAVKNQCADCAGG